MRNNSYIQAIERAGGLNQLVIIETRTDYTRTESGKSWKSQPDNVTRQEVTADNYKNVFDAIPFFRNLGGIETVAYSYTYAGYIPTSVASTNPDRTRKTVRTYDFIMK